MSVTAHASGTKTPPIGTFTVTIASPAVFSKTAHGLAQGDKVTFTTTGALPTGLTAGTTYFVQSAGLAADSFRVSTTDGGSDLNTSGSQSGTHSMISECFLTGVNVAGTFTLHVDSINVVALDAFELRAYQMILTGGTPRVAYYAQWFGAQPVDDMIKISVPISNELTDTNALRFSLKQIAPATGGTGRAFPWKVLKYA